MLSFRCTASSRVAYYLLDFAVRSLLLDPITCMFPARTVGWPAAVLWLCTVPNVVEGVTDRQRKFESRLHTALMCSLALFRAEEEDGKKIRLVS